MVFELIVIVVLVLLGSVKVINEYERGVKFTLGKFSGIMGPGLNIVIPVLQTYQRVDIRIITIDVPEQDCMTKDNVSTRVNAVLYFKVADAERAILDVENYAYATSQLAQTTMRDVVGQVELDELLSNRDAVSNKIQQIVDKATDPWGIEVESVDMKHIDMADEMKRVIAKQAEGEREKRATIIKSEGDVIAAENLAKAAQTLSEQVGALHLRTLQSINDISSDQSNTIVFALPLEVLRAFEKVSKKKE